jgi:hypothetical protein
LQTAALPLGYPAESFSQSRFAGFSPFLVCFSLPNCCQFSGTTRMSGRQLRIVPDNGNRAYKYYLDGYKVNGKRKRLFFKDEAAAGAKKQQASGSLTAMIFSGLLRRLK